jgi:cytochrome c556
MSACGTSLTFAGRPKSGGLLLIAGMDGMAEAPELLLHFSRLLSIPPREDALPCQPPEEVTMRSAASDALPEFMSALELRRPARRLGVAAAAILSGVAIAVAQDTPQVVVKRQQTKSGMFADLTTVRGFIDGRVTQARAVAAAEALARTLAELPEMFPPGTSSADLPGKTRAKPQIWADRDKFVEAAKVMEDQAQKLAEAVKSGDKAQAQMLFGVVSNDCNGACHSAFRGPNS